MKHAWIQHLAMAAGSLLMASSLYGFGDDNSLDNALRNKLEALGFTGTKQFEVEQRLGRPINAKLANLGRLLWFDKIAGLNNDNTCGGCHSPMNGLGDSQSIAIGVDNNNIVGPHRAGPRNQRRTPMAVNTVFYPKLMWNGRFSSLSGDPFNNSAGFSFPLPEGLSLSGQSHLLRAQAFIPPTERVEAAGFVFPGGNQDIRDEVMRRINATPNYRFLFGQVDPAVANGAPITYDHFAAAIAEFEFTQVYANAPIDKFARGKNAAMTTSMKKGALLFFGKANCVSCHSVSGNSNEMFSDFENHVAGTPQVVPRTSNMTYDGPGLNEDFGLEQVTGDSADRYKFRSAPLRNLATQPAFFHNGAFTDLEAAMRYHLNPKANIARYSPRSLAPDLRGPIGPMADVMNRLDPALATPTRLNHEEFEDLVTFVRDGLLDERASAKKLAKMIPTTVPSLMQPLVFEKP